MSVDGLPFMTEGFERANTMLKIKYGNPNKVENVHVQYIIGLPTIHGARPAKIHDFYRRLTSHMQVVETE